MRKANRHSLYWAAKWGSKEVCSLLSQRFYPLIAEVFYDHDKTAIQAAFNEERWDIAWAMLSQLQSRYSNCRVFELVFQHRDRNDYSLMDYAAIEQNDQNAQQGISFVVRAVMHLELHDRLEELLVAKDCHGSTPLHHAAAWGHIHALQCLFGAAGSCSSGQELQMRLLQELNHSGHNLLMAAAAGNSGTGPRDPATSGATIDCLLDMVSIWNAYKLPEPHVSLHRHVANHCETSSL